MSEACLSKGTMNGFQGAASVRMPVYLTRDIVHGHAADASVIAVASSRYTVTELGRYNLKLLWSSLSHILPFRFWRLLRMAGRSPKTPSPCLIILLSLCLFALLSRIASLHGGQTEPLRVQVSLVTVGVRVTDASGHTVPNLEANDFLVYEDSIAQQIASFSREEQPISFGIALDISDSMGYGDKLERAKAAAQMIVGAGRPGDEYLYVTFDGNVVIRTEFTGDRESLKRAIAATTLGRGTALYDAVVDSLGRFTRARNRRQALIVITDGADQHSRRKLNEVIRALQESRVQLFAIGYFSVDEAEIFRTTNDRIWLNPSGSIDNPRIVFRRLAKESGADAFFPTSDHTLEIAAEKITADLRTQYTLAYYPSNSQPNERYRKIRVKVRPGGLKVRARQGYVLSDPAAKGARW